jgi:hypothetical protein
MPSLQACPKCGELCWNRTPSAFSLARSLHVLREGAKCPICNTKVADLITDPKTEPPARFAGINNPVPKDKIEMLVSRAKVHARLQREMSAARSPQWLKNPRLAHYEFAHLMMRCFVFGPNDAPRSLLNRESARVAIDLLAAAENQELRQIGSQSSINANEILVDAFELCLYPDSFPVIIVRMPEAVIPAEAHLVGIVVRGEQESSDNSAKPLYFTLEKMESTGEFPTTCIGEWRDAGQRKNHGHGPRPETVEDFVEYVGRIVSAGLWQWE